MTNTLQEIDDLIHVGERLVPLAKQYGGFIPGAGPLIVASSAIAGPLLELFDRAIHAIMAAQGKPADQAIVDVINTLTPGKDNSPVLTNPVGE